MRALVVFESMWGNTAEIGRAIGRGLADVPVVDVGQVWGEDMEGLDLLVLGGPTHAFSMTRAPTRHDAHEKGATQGDEARGIRELMDELPATCAVPVATFDTRVAQAKRLPGSAAKDAARKLRHYHHVNGVACESFWVDDIAGPLLDGELDRAAAWGAELAQSLSLAR